MCTLTVLTSDKDHDHSLITESFENIFTVLYPSSCLCIGHLPASPKLPKMINKSGLHLIIVQLSFNVIPFHGSLSLLSSQAISFCLIQRWNVRRGPLIIRCFDLRLNLFKKARLNICHLQLTNTLPLLVSFEDSLSSRIINSFFKVIGKCHFEWAQIFICYARLLCIKANV